MATDWLGSIVSINCGDSLGVYQGRVSAVNQASQTISLTRPFHNGVKCLVPEVTFRAGDITELKILEIPGLGDNGQCGDFHHPDLGIPVLECPGGASQNGTGKLLRKPTSAPQNIPRRTDVKAQEVALSPQLHPCSKSYMESLNPSKNFRRRHNSWSSSSRHPNQATPKKSGLKNGQMKSKDDECFGDDIEEIPDTDFDFEGNLALFDKAAVFEEIETYERKGGTRSRGTPSEKAAARYRHDENILESEPIVYRRITVPRRAKSSARFYLNEGMEFLYVRGCPREEEGVKLFSKAPESQTKNNGWKLNKERFNLEIRTARAIHPWNRSYLWKLWELHHWRRSRRDWTAIDSGLVVPSVSYELHKKLLSVAEKHGLTLERRLEMTGVCASQMALSLLGGPNRLNPKNIHQRPTVALLCGPHVKGAQGISCGRHLSNHDVDVILFLPNFVKMLESITNELTLFSKTEGQQVSSIKDLPETPVDLVINCLDCHENIFLRDQPWYKAAVDWANQNRAPVLSLDPPVNEMEQEIDAKWSLALGLPLPLGERAGRLYLCDIGIPQKVFQEVGINYHSPFGCKFVIPLHST